MRSTGDPHLEVCGGCRRMQELWEELFGEETPAPPPGTTAEPEWKRVPQSNVMGKQPTPRRARELAPENRCPVCEKWKQERYSTCFDCSGITLCQSCKANYHSKEHEICYQCSRQEKE